MSRTLAFLGLGAMGWPMAAQLARHTKETGGRTLVWNRTQAKADAHAREFGSEAAALPEVAAADVIFSCLPTSAEVDEVLTALGGQLRAGAVWVDCTSGQPEAARRQAAGLAGRGVAFLDAPVSGGPGGAAAGKLTVMVGGDTAVLERVRADLAFAAKVVHVGDVGAGFAVKAINNTLMAVNMWAAGEGLAALARTGVDLHAALDVINASSGRSYPTEALIPQRVLTREFPVTFQLGLLAKDAGIAAEVVQDARASAPVLTQVAALYRAAAHSIGAEADYSAALKLVEQMNGTEIK
ncbi:NAD(P)-dependent oxidoreductase [Deinococcus metallilatus]|uniref:3-hydroxyisobutyrate dehydrogenase n=1 Tax=Deinococcus metallilatus TaxID=1211322 RepID=A0AAJ5F5K2_9DEIO|nr:NAD(P)-dependent oxidoreductase [Deinococcus metallilatus]MBB5294072.1 3-hydroxyisobutyrate dehydrogenase [Deinococcus metallilatus]QBY08859.1 NAD(P)-dependent oxidoreductase [Deinococcus metallilatus]RXJ10003.1 NAD(P)-dependent oxidoreductase [Deinococcus metallilatus]TLK28060.1 NAD(P)-dependent oxidoreductase [Deinococcus metallilatus]GMA16592.1 3-hydroxyisobutyrate dehydrogenase [Deinococcus metallilatus]